MRAVIYCRVSTREQVENLSLATQEEECRSYCDREGLDVDKVFREEGESAKTADRPRLREMIAFCGQNRKMIDQVVVYSVSRFSRQVKDHYALTAVLGKYNIRLRSATEPIDDTSSGQLLEGMTAVVSQYDNAVRSERTIAGMRKAQQLGRWTHQPPIGYRKPSRVTAAPSLEPDPEVAPFVTRAFELFATGSLTKTEVLAEMTGLGLRTRNGSRMSKQSFSNLLQNPIYRGRIVSEKWAMDVSGDFAPLVPEETFVEVQAVLAGRRPSVHGRRRDHPDFPLRRFIRCGKCDGPLTASWSTGRRDRYPYYRCPNAKCRVNVHRDILEDEFRAALHGLTVDTTILDLYEEIVRDLWKQRHARCLDRQKGLRRRLHDLEEKEGRLLDAHIYRGKISDDTFARESQRLRDDMDEVKLQVRGSQPESLDIERSLRFARSLLKSPSDFWQRADSRHRPRLQQAIYPNGLHFDGELTGTTDTSLVFSYLNEFKSEKEGVASPTGLEPVLPP